MHSCAPADQNSSLCPNNGLSGRKFSELRGEVPNTLFGDESVLCTVQTSSASTWVARRFQRA